MLRDKEANYEVGYGKPPCHTRFVKGQSGNPRGRPPGTKNLKTLLSEALNEMVIVTDNGRSRKITKREVTQEGYCQVLVSGSRVTPQPSTPAPNTVCMPSWVASSRKSPHWFAFGRASCRSRRRTAASVFALANSSVSSCAQLRRIPRYSRFV